MNQNLLQMTKRLCPLLLLLLLTLACGYNKTTQKVNTASQDDFIGTFYEPNSGNILFEIFKDSTGWITRKPEVDHKKRQKPIKLVTLDEVKSSWNGFCSDSFEKWMTKVIGGDDWEENIIGGFGSGSSREEFLFVQVKEGYQSLEHIYKTGYVVITGTECFLYRQDRVNVEKLE